jgi:endogenous inhibitor of DNA gyrase (YacG/DUF329 family)
MTRTCKKCKQNFDWDPIDIIAFLTSTRAIVPCPHCHKFHIVTINKE